ncbi:MAG: hypothetical protein QN183_13860 [Armatimonadota bacterium]|nr:hypothetical protein [Armatimonadota bacterium]
MYKTYIIEQRGDQWCVLDEAGQRVLGCHDTREEALDQLRAIEASKAARGHCEIRDWVVFRAGTWNGDTYTVDDLRAMADAFTRVGFTPPLKLGHVDDPGAPAVGWVVGLRVDGDRLLADVADVDPQVCQALREHKYGPASAEVYWDLERDGVVYPRVLGAVALLGANIPAVSGLPHARPAMTVGSVRVYHVGEAPMPTQDRLTITREMMEKFCAPCAQKMAEQNITAIHVRRNPDGTYELPGDMPSAAFRALCEKWAPDEGFRTRCMDDAGRFADDPAAFCNALKQACLRAGLLSEAARPHTEHIGGPDLDQALDDLRRRVDELAAMLAALQEAVAALQQPQRPAASAALSFDGLPRSVAQTLQQLAAGGVPQDALRAHVDALRAAMAAGWGEVSRGDLPSRPRTRTEAAVEVDRRARKLAAERRWEYTEAVRHVLADDPALASEYLGGA